MARDAWGAIHRCHIGEKQMNTCETHDYHYHFFSDCEKFVELMRGRKNLRYLSSNITL
jgi:DNA polymerase II small subunit/DNA polymerase delta subunit B